MLDNGLDCVYTICIGGKIFMERLTLYNLLGRAILYDWREVVEKDTIECFDQREHETETELLKELPERCKDTLRHYCLAIEERMDILNLGIQIGTELESAFILDED